MCEETPQLRRHKINFYNTLIRYLCNNSIAINGIRANAKKLRKAFLLQNIPTGFPTENFIDELMKFHKQIKNKYIKKNIAF